MNIKILLPFRLKYYILLIIQKLKGYPYFSSIKLDKNRHQVYIFLAADYGNLGDVAITYAQTKFLEKYANRQVVEIPISKSLEGLWFVKANIKEGDIVTTVGGGNMGDLYDQIEYIRQLAISFFPKNKFISFPQTFDFSDTNQGKKALKKAVKCYSKHKNLTLVAREEISYTLMQQHFQKNKIILTPDIVLSLNKSQNQSKREGVVFCLRNDEEKSLSSQQNEEIISVTSSYFPKFEFYDTHIGRNNLSIEDRENELNKIWNKFKGAELVVTDRLHGMIFCYITNTPCIVFQNNNHKVRETVKWLPANSNIFLINEFSKEVLEFIIKKCSSYKYDYHVINNFQTIVEGLK